MQLIGNPAQNPEYVFIAVFGLPARVAFWQDRRIASG
jgi:hypothetical protein